MKRLFLIITALFVACGAFAQATFTVQVPSVVSLDEQFNLSFIVEGDKVTDFQWPQTSDFDVLWGPQTGRSSQTTIINGKVTKSTSTTYTYVLMPKKEGTFTLPPCSAKLKGKTISSSSTTIKVVKGKSSSSSVDGSSQSASSGTVSGEDLFMRLIVDKRNVVLGEPINATLKLYKRVPVTGFEDVHFPSFDGFWSQSTSSPANIEFQRESIGDQVYETAVLRSYKIIPQKVGELIIEPAELICVVQVRSNNVSSGSLFDAFFQNDYSSVRKRVKSKQISIQVEDLPQPRPASFCGGVGHFDISAKINRDSIKTHDAASLVVRIKGEGNLALLEAPKINFPPDFEVYDVKSSDEPGVKVFEYPFIPRHHGHFTLGPVEFSYYDIDARRFVSLSTDAISLDVKKGTSSETESSPISYKGTAGKDVKDLGTDIRYICTGSSNLRDKDMFFVSSPLFVTLCIVLTVGAILFVLIFYKVRGRKADVLSERRRGASKAVKKRLARSKNYLDQGLDGAFYEELHRALLGFVADRFSLDSSDMDKDTLKEKLLSSGMNESIVSKYIELLDTCEYARYSPSSQGGASSDLYNKALETIETMDNSLNKRHIKNEGIVPMLLALMCLSGAQFTSKAAEVDAWEDGVSLYASGDYGGALDKWHSILDEGKESPELYYNMGCASFKLSEISYAVLYFEKALKLDPTYSDAKHNLEYVQQFVQDRIDSVPEFFLSRWVKSARSLLTSDGWAVVALIMLIIALAGAVLYFVGGARRAKVSGFTCFILGAVLFVTCFSFSLSLKRSASEHSYAVVMSAVTVVKSSPDANSGTDLFVLHEGTKGKILQQIGEWYNIELADGRQGWTSKSNLEII